MLRIHNLQEISRFRGKLVSLPTVGHKHASLDKHTKLDEHTGLYKNTSLLQNLFFTNP